ncbi:MAG: thioredoxin TrxA [Candidatus Competibacterales bacterium]
MTQAIVQATDETFEDEVLNADRPVLVDYWAEWCGPCKVIAPILQDLAGEYQDRLKIAKVNIDDCPTTASRYNIRAIPTLILFRGGQVVDTRQGAMSRSQLAAFVDSYL